MRYGSYIMKGGALARLLLLALGMGALMDARSLCGATYLVHSGQPNADIVISNNPPRMVTLAASELQKYVFKITGATLPIVTVPAASNHIYVGRSIYTDGFGLSDTGLLYDAFRMVSGSNWLALLGHDSDFSPPQPYATGNSDIPRMLSEWDGLTGQTWDNPHSILYKDYSGTKLGGIWKYDQRGSLNAVNEYLRGLGVRWFFPGDIGEVVPSMASLPLPVTNVVVHPDFGYRNMYIVYHQFGHADATTNEILWQLRLGINGGRETIGLAWPAHGTLNVIARDPVKQAHPEYYQMKNGVRDTTNAYFGPCLSSEGLYTQNVAYLKALCAVYSNDTPSVNVMPSDGYGELCECPLCVGKDTPARGYAGKLSDYVWTYVNRVATNLYASYPDRKVTCCAYTTYQLPPTNAMTFCTNVVMGWCAWRTDSRDPAEWAAYTNQVAAWLSVLPSKQYFRYDYYLHSDRDPWDGVPVYFPQLISRDLKFQKGKSLGECIEVYHNYGPNGDTWNAMAANHLNVYVTARLYWDAGQDIDALLSDYYEKFYGPVAAPMKAFIEYCEQHWATMRHSKPEMDAALAMLDAAGAAAGTGIYSQRVAVLVEYVKPMRALRDAMVDHYVAQNGQIPVYPYTNWLMAASNIQEAVELGWTNTTVWVGPGRYTMPPHATNYIGTNVVYINRPMALRAVDGMPQNTVIDGQGICRGVTMYYPGDSAVPFVLDGFTISNCYATNRGGGLLLESANCAWTGVVQNCVLSDNTVAGNDGNLYPSGGALYSYTASGALGLVMSNCWIRGNQATNLAVGARSQAGGVFLRNSGQKLFAGCVIENNRAGLGGGVYSTSGTLTFEKTVIRNNGAVMSENAIWGGGGIYLGGSDLSMRNCLMYGNRAAGGGGAIANQSQSSNFVMEVRNCTIVSNTAGGNGGGGIYIRERSVALGGTPTLRLYNSIVYSNTSDNLSLAVVTPFPSNVAFNSCFTPTNLFLGTTNRIVVVNCLTNNPQFADYATGDFRVVSNSPCINTGTNQDWMAGAVDLQGLPRLMGGTVDMGCYEYGFPKGVIIWMR